MLSVARLEPVAAKHRVDVDEARGVRGQPEIGFGDVLADQALHIAPRTDAGAGQKLGHAFALRRVGGLTGLVRLGS